MQYLNSDGSACPLKLSLTLKSLAKSVNDSIYYCFEDLSNDKRLLAIEAHDKILSLATTLEKESDEFFN